LTTIYLLPEAHLQKATLPREISVVCHQERCEEKGTKMEITLNATIMVKLV